MTSNLSPSPQSLRYPARPALPVSVPVKPALPVSVPVKLPAPVRFQQSAPRAKRASKPATVQGDWWPCFICGSDWICAHRETDIVAWMERTREAKVAPRNSAEPSPTDAEAKGIAEAELAKFTAVQMITEIEGKPRACHEW